MFDLKGPDFFLSSASNMHTYLKKERKKGVNKRNIPPLSQKGGVRLEKASHSNVIPTIM